MDRQTSQSLRSLSGAEAALSLTEEEIAAMIAGVLDGSVAVPSGVSKEDAVSALLKELPDAPPQEVTDAVARLVGAELDAEDREPNS